MLNDTILLRHPHMCHLNACHEFYRTMQWAYSDRVRDTHLDDRVHVKRTDDLRTITQKHLGIPTYNAVGLFRMLRVRIPS